LDKNAIFVTIKYTPENHRKGVQYNQNLMNWYTFGGEWVYV